MKTNEEIRADLIVKYGWELNENNELFPFVKLLYLKSENTNEKIDELRNIVNDTKKTVQKNNVPHIYFENSKQAFWYAFGKFGVVVTILILSVLLVYVLTLVNSHTSMEQNNESIKTEELQELNKKSSRNKLNNKVKFKNQTSFLFC